MKNNTKALIMTAALTGLLGGTTTRLHAQVNSESNHTTVTSNSDLGVLAHWSTTNADAAKHSCKGKNDCKGQGGCKSSDNGCNGKNSCKGKGGCATDGSPMPH
jgi:hypothetical protein